MTEPDRLARNVARLQDCFPVFGAALRAVLTRLEAAGWRPRIQEAWRSEVDEREAFATGHSKVAYGFHNCTSPTGLPEALAADVLDDDAPLHPSRTFELALARAAQAEGLMTGIAWGLPPMTARAVQETIENGGDWNGAVGWDPLHLQCVGITIAAAKLGRRPTLTPRAVTA